MSKPYTFTQSKQTASLTTQVPGNIKKADVVVEFTPTTIKAMLKNGPVIVQGTLFGRIRPSESIWLMESGSGGTKEFSIHLDKTTQLKWPFLLRGDKDSPIDHSNYSPYERFEIGRLFELGPDAAEKSDHQKKTSPFPSYFTKVLLKTVI